MNTKKFIGENISDTARIQLHSDIETVLPLFTPLEEIKWAESWMPEVIFGEEVKPGMIFQTNGKFEGEDKYNWILSEYNPGSYEIKYTVFTAERLWLITVKCERASAGGTIATINYTYYGLSERGNQLNAMALKEMFSVRLKDWEDAINDYLETGESKITK